MLKIRKNPNEISRVVSSGALSYNKAEARRRKKTSTRPLIVLGVIGFAVSIYSYSHFIIFSNDCQQLGKSDTPPKKALVIAKNSNKENTTVYTLDDASAQKIANKWDKARDTFVTGGAWHQHPLVVKSYKQRLAANSPNFVAHLLEKYGKRQKCLSIGCGDGGIELEMVKGGVYETMRGVDLSPARVETANQAVPEELKGKMEFLVQNAEKDLNGQEYDLVLFTHALHHIFDLESMSRALRDRIMKPKDVILVLEEYVGPVRWQFSDHHLNLMADFFHNVESKFPHYTEKIRQNPLWDGTKFVPPNAESVEQDDPSETIRSNEIVSVLSDHLSLIEDVPLGGNFFQWIFHNVYNSLTDEEGTIIVKMMLEAEMKTIQNGDLTSDYVFQVWKLPS